VRHHEGGRRRIRIALTGDSLIARAEVPVPQMALRRLVAALGRVDAAFTNLETPVNDGLGHPTSRDTGTWCSASSDALSTLRRLGFDLFACANNHSLDWAVEGMLRTRAAIEEQGALCAGIGESLAEARRPALKQTDRGTIALVSMSATYPEAWRAGDPHGDVPGRPGLNPLGHVLRYVVPDRLWPALTELNDLLKLDAHHRRRVRIGFALEPPNDTLQLLGQNFIRGGTAEIRHEAEPGDAQANLDAIAAASRHAALVIASIHSHEMGPGGEEDPPGFLAPFAQECIEAGAGIVVCHGPHLLRGIEIYRNRPIFYSLGNFVFQNELNRLQPLEYFERYGVEPGASVDDLFDKRSAKGGYPAERQYWESIIVRCDMCDDGLVRLELTPVVLGFGLPRERRGFPIVAPLDDRQRILDRLDRLSRPNGVNVVAGEASAVAVW
jgi:poly-gamma-glutamate capsule biosynthesis protein CapA/YwtB (metallophosphatase superfamily)